MRWDARVDTLGVANGIVTGVTLADGETLACDAVVLAAGHSARELYQELIDKGAELVPKDFAVGFRIEHPQNVINHAQYGDLASGCLDGGRGVLPPASTRSLHTALGRPPLLTSLGATWQVLPPASYRLATTVDAAERAAADEPTSEAPAASRSGRGDKTANGRGVYSFCMCPGGQIVPTSLDKGRLCINGMSYSNRGSKWANSAVVVRVRQAEPHVCSAPLYGTRMASFGRVSLLIPARIAL